MRLQKTAKHLANTQIHKNSSHRRRLLTSQTSPVVPDSTLARIAARKPRRAVFNVPGSDGRKLNKAAAMDLDVVVLDFEDGVALNSKADARRLVKEALAQHSFGRAEKLIRINSVRSGYEFADLESLVPSLDKIDGILLPKAESAHDIKLVDQFLIEAGDTEGRVKIWPAIESASSLLNLKQICESSPKRLDALIFASEDYAADTGITRTDMASELIYARSTVVTHAAAYRLSAIDMVCIKYKDENQLIAECQQGYNLGFDGKQAIHPAQVDVIYKHFTPPVAQIELAKKIVLASRQNLNDGVGAWEIDGKMIDMPMVKWAIKILQKANVTV